MDPPRKLGPGQLFLEWTDAVRVHGRKAGMGTMVTTAGAMPKSPFESFWWVVLWDGSLGFTSTEKKCCFCVQTTGAPRAQGDTRLVLAPKWCAVATQMTIGRMFESHIYVGARSTSILWKSRKIDSDIDSAS